MTAKSFSLAGKGLKLDTEDDILLHIRPLINSDDWMHIDLSGNTFGVLACEALAPFLSKMKKLESIYLHDIFTSRTIDEIPPSLSALLTALLECPVLHSVDLSDNALGWKVKEPLVDFLSRHTPLQHLKLSNNGMGLAATPVAEALTALATRKQTLRDQGKDVVRLESIVCNQNRLENHSMAAWAKAYEAHKDGMRIVKMTQDGIRPEGISLLLTSGLRHCSKLQVLDLQDNTFAFPGGVALASAIVQWPELRELGVGDDLIGARGSIRLFEALGKGQNTAVEILRLQYNDINPKGLASLLVAVKEGLPSLRRVELNGNKFDEDDASVDALAEVLSGRKARYAKGATDSTEEWGLDDLDELEGEESEEEESSAEEEQENVREKVLKEADEEEDEKVAQRKDTDVDELADTLKRTEI